MLVLAVVAALLAALALARPAAAEEALVLEKTVNVPENVPGDGRQDFDTGVDVQTGDRVVVEDTGLRDYVNAKGVVYPAGRALARWWHPTGPEGYPSSGDGSCTANSNYPLSSARCFSLLGKINKQYFYVGASKDWVHQGISDRLLMIVNDDAPGNGEGYFQVRIRVFRDIPLPNTSITSGPSGVVNTTSAAFGFSSDRGVGFQCRLDGGVFEDCSSPKSYSGLPDGEHTFFVRAIDQHGRPDPSPDQRSWTVDTVAPDTTIDSGPSGTVNTASASFGFSPNEAGVTFQCRLDGGAFEPCSSPKSYSGLPEGSHTFEVSARDAAGNVELTPAQRFWKVDVTAPRITGVEPTGTGVKRHTSLTATFAEQMKASTIKTSTFKLYKVNSDGTTTQITNVTVALSSDGLRATLDPFGTSTGLLAKNTKYKVIVTSGAQDLASNALDQNPTRSGSQPKVWRFTTGSS